MNIQINNIDKEYLDFQSSINFKINKISRLNKLYLSRLARPYKNLNMPELYMINVIGDLKKTNIKFIETIHWSDQALISRTIKKLIKDGYAYEKKNNKDRRYKEIKLTEKGFKVRNEFVKQLKIRTNKLFTDFTDDEVVQLKLLLDKMVESCKKYLSS